MNERLIIRVPCRLCNRLHVVPNGDWLTVPRPCCDPCAELEPPTVRTDADGWPLVVGRQGIHG